MARGNSKISLHLLNNHCLLTILHSEPCLPSSFVVASLPVPPPAGPLPAASQPALAPSCPGRVAAFELQAPWRGVLPGVGPAQFAFPVIHFGAPLLPVGYLQQMFKIRKTVLYICQ